MHQKPGLNTVPFVHSASVMGNQKRKLYFVEQIVLSQKHVPPSFASYMIQYMPIILRFITKCKGLKGDPLFIFDFYLNALTTGRAMETLMFALIYSTLKIGYREYFNPHFKF